MLHLLKMVLGQTSERQTSEWTNIRVTNVREDKHQSAKRQRRQTSEWDKRQRNFGFCQTLTFCLNFKKIPLSALTMVRFCILDYKSIFFHLIYFCRSIFSTVLVIDTFYAKY